MSLDTKVNIWLELAQAKYPTLTENHLRALSLRAASEWYSGDNTELANMFDQYVMIKNLRGIENGD